LVVKGTSTAETQLFSRAIKNVYYVEEISVLINYNYYVLRRHIFSDFHVTA